MKKNCKTCEWNFPKQGGSKGRVCAHQYPGREISELLKTVEFPCGGWNISFKAWQKQEAEERKRIYGKEKR